MPEADAFRRVTERLCPGSRLTRYWPLTGGVSAVMHALEVHTAEGTSRRFVVRRHGPDSWKPLEADIAGEFALLKTLKKAGFPVPETCQLDTSSQLLHSPYLVMEFVEGTTSLEASQLSSALPAMAQCLLQLHELDPKALELPPLPRRDQPIDEVLESLPRRPDLAAVRQALMTRPRLLGQHAASLLHGDFWPGNILWQAGRIAAVLDWEDAAIGDPLSDLAGARLELYWAHGEQAMQAFTRHYLARSPRDPRDLAVWDLCVSAGAAAVLHRWGLEPEREARMKSRAHRLMQQAARRFLEQTD